MKRKLKLTKKKITIIVVGLSIIVIGTVVGVKTYQNNEREKQITLYQEQISDIHNTFTDSSDREAKIIALTELLKDYDDFIKSNDNFEDVEAEYIKEIGFMQKHFTDGYYDVIKTNTIENVEMVEVVGDITFKKEELTLLLETIKKEVGITCNEELAQELENTINSLISSYNSRLTALEEKRLEEEKIAQEKAQAEEEAAKNPQNQGSQNNGNENNSNSGGGTGGSDSGNGNNNGDGQTCVIVREGWVESNGVKEYYKMDSCGNVYDINGNLVGNNNDWW